jgi:hypothetical protein
MVSNLFTAMDNFLEPLLSYLAQNSAIWQQCLLQETREKAADAHIKASSIWSSCGRFHHRARKIAAGAHTAGIRSQAKRTTAKLEYLKFSNENELKKKNKYAPCRVAMCE